MWCHDNKLDVIMMVKPDPGAFGKIGTLRWETGRQKRLRVLFWYSCREDFFQGTTREEFDHQGIADRRTFLYVLRKPKEAAGVVAFIGKFEDRLGLDKKTKFGPTGRDNVIWYKPTPWWQRSNARRSLFTALLRTAVHYRPAVDNFQQTINYRDYTKKTRKAVDHFLAGHTTYRGKLFDGWQSTFQSRSDEEIQRMLVKPRGKMNVARE